MRSSLSAINLRTAFLATGAMTDAAAQNVLNLSGRYVCVRECATGIAGLPAYVTQNGWDMKSGKRGRHAISRLDRLAGAHLGAEFSRGSSLFA
jgi:phage portal protein BeeE